MDYMIEQEYLLLHNIIYGAIEFADDLGIKPHKDFDLICHVLEPDDSDEE